MDVSEIKEIYTVTLPHQITRKYKFKTFRVSFKIVFPRGSQKVWKLGLGGDSYYSSKPEKACIKSILRGDSHTKPLCFIGDQPAVWSL